MIKSLSLVFVSLLFFCNQLVAQDWQWSMDMDSTGVVQKENSSIAYLWIPSECEEVRGAVITTNNTIAEGIFERENFRAGLAKIGFAEVWVLPGTGTSTDNDFGSILKSLADGSGYAELEFVPLLPVINISGIERTWNLGDQNKILAGISVDDATGTGDKSSPVPRQFIEKADSIPWLFATGQDPSNDAMARLDDVVRHSELLSIFNNTGSPYFNYTEEAVGYLSIYITRAAQYRLYDVKHTVGEVRLKSIDPQKGWLTDRWQKDGPPATRAVTYKDYKGDKTHASWSFDEEMASTIQQLQKVKGKQTQSIEFQQEAVAVKSSSNGAVLIAPFMPLADGISFHLSAFFSDSSKIGVTTSHLKMPLLIEKICGPVKKISDTIFRINFYRWHLSNSLRKDTIRLLASGKRNEFYQEAVQELRLPVPSRNREGKAQKIIFPNIPDQREGIRYLQMTGSSDAGLPVNYYIQEGPAEIQGRAVKFLPVPPKSKFPVKITVVAWQYGSSIEPAVQSAEPVVQSFYLVK